MKGLPQAPSQFQKTVFQKGKAISNNVNGYALKSGQICEHAQSRTINCVIAVTKCITTIELYYLLDTVAQHCTKQIAID